MAIYLDYWEISIKSDQLKLEESQSNFDRYTSIIKIAEDICEHHAANDRIKALRNLEEFDFPINDSFCWEFNGPKFDWNAMAEPAKGKLTNSFGCRQHPTSGHNRMFKGINLSNKRGTNIKSVHLGHVASIGEAKELGKYIIVRHGERWLSHYGNLGEILVKQGDIVDTGEKIGIMGSTGLATGVVLTFMISHDDIFFNPYNKKQNSENQTC